MINETLQDRDQTTSNRKMEKHKKRINRSQMQEIYQNTNHNTNNEVDLSREKLEIS